VFSDFADTAFAARAMTLLKHDPAYAACLVKGTAARSLTTDRG
jgi:glycerophosphoryl diester phosphodiesterase